MKTFVILSDSHGRRGALDRVSSLFGENDFIVHLGDGAGDMRKTAEEYPEKTFVLRGNCDMTYAPEETVIEAERVRILCCHGHRFGVKSGLGRLAARAKELDCDAALYGHTHRAAIERVDGVLLVNPGALGSFSCPSYAYMVVHGDKITATIVPLA